jgi:hypothetical protein
MYTAWVDPGQLMHVLYPLCNLICTIFNSRPSEELTFHLSYCYFAASAAWDMIEIWRIHIGVWPMYTAGIDLGQLMHVLYPLCSLICAIFNLRPPKEPTFHLRCCYLFRCGRSMTHARDMAYPHRRVANAYSWDRFRAAHACFIPAVKLYLRYIQLKTIRRAHIMLLFYEHAHHSPLHLHVAFGSTNHRSSRVPPA